MAATISIALPAALRDLIAQAAKAQGVTQDRLATTVLAQQLDAFDALGASVSPELAAQILGHPRLISAWPKPAMLHVDRAVSDRAGVLAQQLGAVSGQKIPKGRLIQALVWQALAPVSADARRALPPPPTPRRSVTVSVPARLNTDLLDQATVRGTSRAALIGALLDFSLAALTDAADATGATLAAWPTEPSTATTATVHLARAYDAPVQAVADQRFAGSKSRALQALLGYAPERMALPVTLPDQPVRISGALYAQVAQRTRAERQGHGRSPAIRTFVEQALERAIVRQQRR